MKRSPPPAARLLRAAWAAVSIAALALPMAAAEPSAEAPLVGAYYYPWYRSGERDGDWRNVLRRRLLPPQTPRAGLYDSADPAVVKEHIAQSRQAGLDFWAVSWWGPETPTDRNFRQALLAHPDAGQIRFAALYESTGRFGSFDAPNYDRWLADLAYLEKHYFGHPRYLRVDGRPVLFIYLTREYFRNKGEAALAAAREKFSDVYLVGDDVFGAGYRAEWARQFDAVTAYDVYGQSTGPHGGTTKAVEALAANYAAARRAANSGGAAFIPTVAPGYNDTAVRPGHPGRARYFSDVPESAEGDVFRAMIRQAALPNLDPRCGRMMMVTSFNEWYEDTQIEATAGDQPPTSDDDSPSKRRHTGGDRYVDYGPLYLDILRELTAAEDERDRD
jgi:hypothetical protein